MSVAPWTPAMLTGKYVWLDASSLTPSWGGRLYDKGPLGHHYSQTDALRTPTLSAINGLPTMVFDGTDDHLVSNTVARSIMRDVSAAWAMIVYLMDDSGAASRQLLNVPIGAFDGAVARFAAAASHATVRPRKPYISGRTLDTDTSTPALWAAKEVVGTWVIAGFFRQFSTGQASVWLDGAQSAAGAIGTAGQTSDTDSVFDLALGAAAQTTAPGFQSPLKGAIAEVIYGAGDQIPDAATQARLEGYLAHKWGLAANLPSGHPYKAAPPVAGAIWTMGGARAMDEHTGLYPVTVTTKVKSLPADAAVAARVSLLRKRDLTLARRGRADAGGTAVFHNMRADQEQYVALAEYPGNPADPTAEGYMRPVAGVSKLEVS